jgi:DNA-binding MarR family transcriptional regulator
MMVLWESSPSTVSALGERLLLDSGTLTPLLKRLEGAGLVCRTRDAADERRVLVSLTAEGLALRSRAEGVPHRLVCRVLGEGEQAESLSADASAAPHSAPLADAVALRSQLQALVHTLSHALDTRGTPSKKPAGA